MSNAEVEGSGQSLCPLCGGIGRASYRGRDLLLDLRVEYRYDSCGECGAVYQEPRPDALTIESFYPPEYLGHAQAARARRLSNAHRAVLKHRDGYTDLAVSRFCSALAPLLGQLLYLDELPAAGRGRAVDLGCGNGRFLLKLSALGWDVQGVDISAAAVAACRNAGLSVEQGDIDSTALPDAAFDLVCARHLLEHLPDPHRFLAGVARILKPGGRLLIQTPNSDALGRRWFGGHWYANDIPRHLVLFNRRNLQALTARYGLALRVLRTFTTPKIILNSWDYRRGRRGEPSKRRKVTRLLARGYVGLAQLLGRGDELFALYERRG